MWSFPTPTLSTCSLHFTSYYYWAAQSSQTHAISSRIFGSISPLPRMLLASPKTLIPLANSFHPLRFSLGFLIHKASPSPSRCLLHGQGWISSFALPRRLQRAFKLTYVCSPLLLRKLYEGIIHHCSCSLNLAKSGRSKNVFWADTHLFLLRQTKVLKMSSLSTFQVYSSNQRATDSPWLGQAAAGLQSKLFSWLSRASPPTLPRQLICKSSHENGNLKNKLPN